MASLADKAILWGADNRPLMLEKDMYDSWKSRMELYMLNRQHGRMILESVEQGPLLWPSVEVEGVTRLKKYSELSAAEAIQADSDVKATNIILQGLPPEVYELVSTHKVAKELWEQIQMLIQGTSLTKQERECKLYDAFDKFAYQKGETLCDFYLRFSLLLNDMNMYNMKLEQFHVNTKFLNTLPSEWSKFITDVKLVRELHTTNAVAADPKTLALAITAGLTGRRDRDDRYHDDPIRSLGLKIKIPKFTDQVHPDDFIDWVSTVERGFDVRDIPDKLKIKAKSKGSTSRFTSRFTLPTRTAPPTALKATTPTTSAAEPKLDKPDAELLYPDHEEALVIQRVLKVVVSKSVDDNLWLRNNIFRTRPAYQMNLKEFAELQRKVTELLEKGLILESMSSCAVLALAKVTEAPVLALPNFDDVFHVECDASGFSKLDGYFFKGARLCIPLCSLHEAIILEGHAGGLAGHFRRDKTLALLREHIYWPKMQCVVNRLLERCRTCHIAKTHSSNAGLYTPLSVHVAPWEGVSLDFVLGLPCTQRAKDFVMVVVDRFLKMVNFVPCSKTFDASQVARLYFEKIVKLHGVSKTLSCDQDGINTDQVDSSPWITSITVNGKNAYELKGKFLDDLHNNAFSETNGKDDVEHIEYFLKIIDPIDLPNINRDKLRIVKMGSHENETTDDESSDPEEYWSDEEETAKIFKIETYVFDYESPLCLAFNEFNYLIKLDPDLLTKDIMEFKTYEE
nr:RNA-directed DNA polymerase [Tanacetum cinerariifolium]